MKRIIIYGVGNVFREHEREIPWDHVAAISDKKAGARLESGRGVPFVPPDQIPGIEYDYIVVFSNLYFEEIQQELIGSYFIPAHKIVPWTALIWDEGAFERGIIEFLKAFVRENGLKSVLDVKMRLVPEFYLGREGLLDREEIIFDGIGGNAYPIYGNLYQHIYERMAACPRRYDLVFLDGIASDIEEELEAVKEKARYLIFPEKYSMEAYAGAEGMRKRLEPYGKVKCFYLPGTVMWSIDTCVGTGAGRSSGDLKIYVVTHKPYQVQEDDIYQPICVGGKYRNPRFLTEHAGDNISYLNEKINECTALYWIWKNTSSKYVGLNHYRRYFYNNNIKNYGNRLDQATAMKLLEQYDVIMPAIYHMYEWTDYERMRESVDEDVFQEGYHIMEQAIAENQPDYTGVFHDVINGHSIYLCNMFVTRREILDLYCEWLFSFLIQAAERMDVRECDAHNKRIIGFFAERMWTVWLMKQNLKIKELPFDNIK